MPSKDTARAQAIWKNEACALPQLSNRGNITRAALKDGLLLMPRAAIWQNRPHKLSQARLT